MHKIWTKHARIPTRIAGKVEGCVDLKHKSKKENDKKHEL